MGDIQSIIAQAADWITVGGFLWHVFGSRIKSAVKRLLRRLRRRLK